jgi:ATP-dependent phosphofructokinase / diphosphate-dependent phosphofructokinase
LSSLPARAPDTLLLAQSGGPTAVINASLAGAIESARRDRRVQRVLGARYGAEGLLAEDFVHLTSLDDGALILLAATPGAALGSSRYRPSDAEIGGAVARLGARGIGWVLMIGGNDTAETLLRLHAAARAAELPIQVAGIPKTTDNDLPGMDHCPGYGSAARYIAIAAREAGLDAAGVRRSDPVKILEVMGRDAGWLAAAAALARETADDPPHLIFLPERPRPVEQMLEEVAVAHRQRGFVVVVLCENQLDDRGQPLAGETPVYTDPHGHSYYESPGAHLARLVQAKLGLRARALQPGALQRTSFAAISPVDAAEARGAGAAAWELVASGRGGSMVTIERESGPDYAVRFGAIPLGKVAHQERRLPDEFITASGTDVTEAFIAYARPLIGGPLPAAFRL